MCGSTNRLDSWKAPNKTTQMHVEPDDITPSVDNPSFNQLQVFDRFAVRPFLL